MGSVTALNRKPLNTWEAATDLFLSSRDLSPKSKRVYALTLNRVGDHLPSRALNELSPEALSQALSASYPDAAPNSWNRHIATLRSFCAFCMKRDFLTGDPTQTLERRRAPIDHTKALTRADIDRLWKRKDVPVRDRCLWRMLYETAARAQEVLRLNVEDLDREQRRAVTVRKGGAIDTIHWATGTARLLPYVIERRSTGPVFLSSRPIQQRRAPAKDDIDHETGLARLSYARAAQSFSSATEGWTLHQLRHSALTHLSEDGVPLPLLMAKSRHQSLKTLQRYVHPSAEAVAALTANHDSLRRR